MPAQVLQGQLVLPDRPPQRGQVVYDDGVIQAIVDDGRYRVTDDLGGCLIAPGLIDLHIHGIAGADTMDGTVAAVETIARRVAAHGVTGFLPTTMTHDEATTRRAIAAVRAYMMQTPSDGAAVLGLHLEGPWIAPAFKGAQNGRYIQPPQPEAVRRLLAEGAGAIEIVTLAPELPEAGAAIAQLVAAGVAVSIGHSGASYEQAERAIALGATQVTHCFNAMTGLHHREPGVVGAALLHDTVIAELIADGVHVAPQVMQVLLRLKGRDRVALVTDAMAATEREDGAYSLGGQTVYVRDGQARLEDGRLAGSTLTLDAAVRNLVALCGVPPHDALHMASAVPATAIGLEHRKGRLSVGYDADLAIFDPQLRPLRTVVAGCTVATTVSPMR